MLGPVLRDRLKSMLIASALTLLLGASTSIAAPEAEPGYFDLYQSYGDALRAGDDAAATSFGRAAWLAAERELGDSPTTGVLAYNYGKLIAISAPVTALEPLRRAEQLLKSGVASLPKAELEAYVALAEFLGIGPSLVRANALRRALRAVESADPRPNVDWASAWINLALADLKGNRHDAALESAQRALAAIEKSAPNNYRARAQALVIGGVARLIPWPRTFENIRLSKNAFFRARALFPLQTDFESFDPILAEAIAWDAAASSVLMSLQGGATPNFGYDGALPLFATQMSPTDCKIEWNERKPPKFPARAGALGYIGAVVIGFHLDDEGPVEARVLAEVPGDAFTKTSMNALNDWRLKSPPSNDPACRERHVAIFHYIITF